MKILLHSITLLQVAVATATIAAAGGSKSGNTIIDLSKDLKPAFGSATSSTAGSKAIDEWASQNPQVRVAIVLEHGKIVADYVREDVDPNVPYHVWSATKSWTSLLIGLMVQENKLSIDETLGEIFTDDDSVWNKITTTTTEDIQFRKDVTIIEMLTMSSGLNSPLLPDIFPELVDGGSAGGGSLVASLSEPTTDDKVFSYLAINNILSYVIVERTGMTPREYLSQNVLPYLGIDDADIEWRQNSDGIEYPFHGIHLTNIQMAKFGQLYLQLGKSSKQNQLLSEDWVQVSTSAQVEYKIEIPDIPDFSMTGYYGFLFWMVSGATQFGNPDIPDMYCALGLGGQDICISPELDRVSIQQRDFDLYGGDLNEGGLIIASVAMNPETVFTMGPPTTQLRGGSSEGGNETRGDDGSIDDAAGATSPASGGDTATGLCRQVMFSSVLTMVGLLLMAL